LALKTHQQAGAPRNRNNKYHVHLKVKNSPFMPLINVNVNVKKSMAVACKESAFLKSSFFHQHHNALARH